MSMETNQGYPHLKKLPEQVSNAGVLYITLRVQVPNNHILTQNLYYNHYYPKPKYLIIGYLDPLGYIRPKEPQLPVDRVGGFRVWYLSGLIYVRLTGYTLCTQKFRAVYKANERGLHGNSSVKRWQPSAQAVRAH